MSSEWRSSLTSRGTGGIGADEVELGFIAGVFGVRGEVRLHLHNRESEMFRKGRTVILIAEDGDRFEAQLRSRPGAGKRILGVVEGIDRRELAEAMVGLRITVAHQALPEPSDGEFYVEEVVGMRVCAGERAFGSVVAVHSTGPVDVLELDTGDYLPCTREHIVAIDRVERVVEVVEDAVHAL